MRCERRYRLLRNAVPSRRANRSAGHTLCVFRSAAQIEGLIGVDLTGVSCILGRSIEYDGP